ncbi:oxidation resistance protein 1a isoform X5 [Nerophis lumbriciformis]|uniref:oxidation resistance protein 1a isoform X5 n=1 Tax=Nerophis lumbriciformis TaxID=546530 RepID=UPI002ADF1E44|nr:oxidation resistance protein 1-like isoform X5 [Nerophis lumbriciformis]
MFSIKRLKQKSQSVDIASQGFSPTLVPASPLNKPASPVAKTTTVLAVQENNTTNSQRRSPRCGELKRGYTIDTGQKKTPEKKDGRRMSFQRPKGTIEYSDSDGPSRPEAVLPPVFSALRQSRVVSSTSEEEEALTEKFLKINCKYITGDKGAVSGVLLVTPNNIMFDPHRMDPLVQAHGCEEYGIMCPLEEVQSAAIFKEITDTKIRETVPDDLEPLPCERHPSQQEPERRLREPGANDSGSGSTAPRSTEGSISEDVFTETELSPIREEEQASSDEVGLDKSSGAASTESVQTVTQEEPTGSQVPGSARSSVSHPEDPLAVKASATEEDTATEKNSQSPLGFKQHSEEKPPSIPTTSTATSQVQRPSSSSSSTSRPGSQSSAAPLSIDTLSVTASPPRDANEGTEVSKTDSMQQEKVEKDDAEQEQKGNSSQERTSRSHKFLCLRVGKPMKKTFVSNASASMQQYAQQGKKHEYWFAVPQERSDHLYVFFMQWSPDMYGEGVRGMSQEPGFMVVKKYEVSDSAEDEPITDLNVKEWEVVSMTEYHRRIDALNSEDLRSLCKRLQITTKEEVNSKHDTSIKTELEPETFKPNLREPSDLLEADQIEKLARNLPPRTIGYPWTLAFGTSKHGMSIKSLYRAMQGQDTPVLMVIKDSDGQVFGALASEPFKVSDGFYGTGETFLFTFNPEFEVYKWTGDNMFFIKGDMDSLAFGGGSGEFGLWLDGDLYHGRSHSCKTFGNPMLSKKEDFYVQDIEIWAFE